MKFKKKVVIYVINIILIKYFCYNNYYQLYIISIALIKLPVCNSRYTCTMYDVGCT